MRTRLDLLTDPSTCRVLEEIAINYGDSIRFSSLTALSHCRLASCVLE